MTGHETLCAYWANTSYNDQETWKGQSKEAGDDVYQKRICIEEDWRRIVIVRIVVLKLYHI